jgi:NDP-sugar pyrophosphorylase family protein
MLPVAILAGGLATRLKPISEETPKALIKINGRPFIDHQMELLRYQGAERIILCVGFLGERIRDYLGDGARYGLSIQYSFDGEKLLGTGGAIKNAIPLLGDEFFILYGDSYLPINFESVERAYLRSKKSALMTVFRNDGQWDTSNVVYIPGGDQEAGKVVSYDKKSPSAEMNYIDYGLSCCKANEILKEKHEFFDIAGVFTRLSSEGQLAGFEAVERFYEIGSFAGIADLSDYLKRQMTQCS